MPNLKIKPGVSLSGVHVETVIGLIVAWSHHPSQSVTVTSVVEGRHSHGSKHYCGNAIDLRTKDISAQDAISWANAVSSALGAQFDVVLESDHLHIEFDPKTGTNYV